MPLMQRPFSRCRSQQPAERRALQRPHRRRSKPERAFRPCFRLHCSEEVDRTAVNLFFFAINPASSRISAQPREPIKSFQIKQDYCFSISLAARSACAPSHLPAGSSEPRVRSDWPLWRTGGDAFTCIDPPVSPAAT